jgi:hypothetical protein
MYFLNFFNHLFRDWRPSVSSQTSIGLQSQVQSETAEALGHTQASHDIAHETQPDQDARFSVDTDTGQKT